MSTRLTAWSLSSILLLSLLAACAPALDRVPGENMSDEVQSAKAAFHESLARQDEKLRQKMLAEIGPWAEKGWPYIPVAYKPEDLPRADIPAFPGAEGGGAWTAGGRGGKVYVVTTLKDSGPGSFREACEAVGPRIVVFNVAGIIELRRRVSIYAPYITIAGQTAPGDGVCIAGETVRVNTHDVVIRHMRFRRGEPYGPLPGHWQRDDALGGDSVIGNVIVDHCSASWGLDENLSMYRQMYQAPGSDVRQKLPTQNLTIQWCISSEALDTWNHAFGATWGGANSTFHHNLFACNTGRNPSIGMGPQFNFVDNVLFNWRHRTADGGGGGLSVNFINNYYKPGPMTQGQLRYRIIRPQGVARVPASLRGKWYVEGNVIEGNEEVTADNWQGGVQPDDAQGGDREKLLASIRADEPLPMPPVEIQPAREAYESVLAASGATRPVRDRVDWRVIEMVRTGEVTYKLGIITDPEQVGGYPEYKGEPYADADGDGMPDDWEKANGLNPNDAADSSRDADGDGYTNIEEWLNATDPRGGC